jgi:hypothetical protein
MRFTGDVQRGATTLLLSLAVMIVVFVRHRENIARLLAREEPRIGARKRAPEAGSTEGENSCASQ